MHFLFIVVYKKKNSNRKQFQSHNRPQYEGVIEHNVNVHCFYYFTSLFCFLMSFHA